MIVNLYDIINNPLPQLLKIKQFQAKQQDFLYDNSIIRFMNKNLYMDKLSSEHIYCLSLTFALSPKGIIQVAVGQNDSCKLDSRILSTGLLLTGAEQFMCFHNHPGYNRKISYDDMVVTNRYKEIGELLGIKFLNHFMITKDFYAECREVDESKYIFGTEV